MDCGIPFCHTGTLLSGMASGCPIHNLIPEWNDLVYRGLWQEALERLHKTNNFPEFTGRVCPAPCEGSCVLGINAPPVTIKNIECAIVDHGWEEGWIVPEPPTVRTGKKVAVVGSGPAGLCAAAQLNRAGHLVTVFERADRLGGLLMYGIPNMKLDKEQVVLRRIKQMEAEGVKFVCQHRSRARIIRRKNCCKEFDAVVLCTGATKPRDLPVDGRATQGRPFRDGISHRQHQAASWTATRTAISFPPTGKDVMVIGGGDTGTDCVGTSMRHGCKSLVQSGNPARARRMDRAKDNPWPEWPKVYRLDYGQEEAAAKFGADPRVYLTTATKFDGDAHGHVKAVHTVQIEWERNEKGQFVPKERSRHGKGPARRNSSCWRWASWARNSRCWKRSASSATPRSNVKAEFEKYTTNIKGVFAAGDCRRGQSLVVWAFNEGRGAARECDRYLMGHTDLP